MAGIDFADGFDVPEPLAWGLTPAQLGTALGGGVLSYLVLHSPLPGAAAVPFAVVAAGAGLTLALIRWEGRPLIAWAAVTARFWMRRRRGLLRVVDAAGGRTPAEPGGFARADPAPHRLAQGSRRQAAGRPGWEPPADEVEARVPLVLLPEPVSRSAAPAVPGPGGGPREVPSLCLADAAVLEAPATLVPARAGLRGRVPHGGDPVPSASGDPAALRAARRITFFSLSGGTGRTTLAVEVAGLLAGRACAGRAWEMLAPSRVALVDLDLMSPRAGIRLGVTAPIDWDLGEAEPIQPAVERLVAVHSSGLEVLPGPARLPRAGDGDRPELVRRLAASVQELERSGCDTIVLDVARDLSALTRWVLAGATDIFVVLTPTAGGVHDAYRSTEALRRLGLRDRLRYVVNRGRIVPALAEALLDVGGRAVAEIPDDPELEAAEMEHRLVGLDGSGPSAAALRVLAGTLDTPPLASDPHGPAPGVRGILRRRAG